MNIITRSWGGSLSSDIFGGKTFACSQFGRKVLGITASVARLNCIFSSAPSFIPLTEDAGLPVTTFRNCKYSKQPVDEKPVWCRGRWVGINSI